MQPTEVKDFIATKTSLYSWLIVARLFFIGGFKGIAFHLPDIVQQEDPVLCEKGEIAVIVIRHLTAMDGGNADFAGAKIGLSPFPYLLIEATSL